MADPQNGTAVDLPHNGNGLHQTVDALPASQQIPAAPPPSLAV